MADDQKQDKDREKKDEHHQDEEIPGVVNYGGHNVFSGNAIGPNATIVNGRRVR